MANIKTNLEKNMEKLLNIDVQDEAVTPEVIKKENTVNPLEDDFLKSRNGLESLLMTGQEALQYSLSIAKQSDDPKAYTVVSDLIKKLADINEQLLELHLKHQRHVLNAAHNAKEEKAPLNVIPETVVPQVTNQTNTIFVGTSAELAKMIKMNIGEKDVTND